MNKIYAFVNSFYDLVVVNAILLWILFWIFRLIIFKLTTNTGLNVNVNDNNNRKK